MNITPKPYTVGQLFSMDSRTFFKIPNYQRLYSWKEVNWENLFDDLEDNPTGYFIGSIVAIPKNIDPLKSILDYEIIDGQQRVTTIGILLLALFLKGNSFIGSVHEEKARKLQSQIRDRLLVNDNADLKFKLLPSNDYDFRYILNDAGIIKQILEKNNVGKRLIFKARKYFLKRLEKFTFEETKLFYDKLCDCTLIGLEVDTVANAFIIFETLNNRGEPLTVIDLLKVVYFNSLKDAKESELKWKLFMDTLNSEDIVVNKRFLLNNYHAFISKYRKINQELPTKITLNTALNAYERLFKSFGKDYIDNLTENAFIFNKLINPSIKDYFYYELSTLNKLDVSQSYMFLLRLLKEQKELLLDNKDVSIILLKLISFFVRRNITNFPQARDVNKLFSSISLNDNLFMIKGSEFVSKVVEIIDREKASNDLINVSLSENGLYDKDYILTKFILSNFNNHKLNKEHKVDFDKVDGDNRPIWTIEHILPETENLNDEWIKSLTGATLLNEESKQKASVIQQEVLHKLGNLTLTGFNSKLGTLPFKQKRDHRDKAGQFDGYRNGHKINESILVHDEWNKNSIEIRNKLFIDFILDYFN
jgi:hypothetical protein